MADGRELGPNRRSAASSMWPSNSGNPASIRTHERSLAPGSPQKYRLTMGCRRQARSGAISRVGSSRDGAPPELESEWSTRRDASFFMSEHPYLVDFRLQNA